MRNLHVSQRLGYVVPAYRDSLKSEVVYYESTKRELQTRPIYECRCDERQTEVRLPRDYRHFSYESNEQFYLFIMNQQSES
jgi:hypothetical protein